MYSYTSLLLGTVLLTFVDAIPTRIPTIEKRQCQKSIFPTIIQALNESSPTTSYPNTCSTNGQTLVYQNFLDSTLTGRVHQIIGFENVPIAAKNCYLNILFPASYPMLAIHGTSPPLDIYNLGTAAQLTQLTSQTQLSGHTFPFNWNTPSQCTPTLIGTTQILPGMSSIVNSSPLDCSGLAGAAGSQVAGQGSIPGQGSTTGKFRRQAVAVGNATGTGMMAFMVQVSKSVSQEAGINYNWAGLTAGNSTPGSSSGTASIASQGQGAATSSAQSAAATGVATNTDATSTGNITDAAMVADLAASSASGVPGQDSLTRRSGNGADSGYNTYTNPWYTLPANPAKRQYSGLSGAAGASPYSMVNGIDNIEGLEAENMGNLQQYGVGSSTGGASGASGAGVGQSGVGSGALSGQSTQGIGAGTNLGSGNNAQYAAMMQRLNASGYSVPSNYAQLGASGANSGSLGAANIGSGTAGTGSLGGVGAGSGYSGASPLGGASGASGINSASLAGANIGGAGTGSLGDVGAGGIASGAGYKRQYGADTGASGASASGTGSLAGASSGGLPGFFLTYDC